MNVQKPINKGYISGVVLTIVHNSEFDLTNSESLSYIVGECGKMW